MKLPWPELPSTHREGESLRQILDYVVWICREMTQVGFHGEADGREWRRRVQKAYSALFIPVIQGHGDRYPPDVPEARNPGIWPDVPAQAIPGMTLRHQLKVIGLLAEELRGRVWLHPRPEEVAEWDRRFALARGFLDHGEALPVPEEAWTEPSKERLEAAEAEQKAIREHSQRRKRRIQRMVRKAAKKKTTKKKAAKKKPTKKAAAKKTTKKKVAAKKPTGKKAAKKKVATKKAAKKATKKTARPKGRKK